MRARRGGNDSVLAKQLLGDTATRLCDLSRLKQEAQQLVVWQWRKVLFGEEEMLAKVPYDIIRLGSTLIRAHINVRPTLPATMSSTFHIACRLLSLLPHTFLCWTCSRTLIVFCLDSRKG